MVMKSFHISSVTPTIVIALLAFVDMFILGLIIAFLKPINFETFFVANLLLIMTSIFIGVIAVTFGLLIYTQTFRHNLFYNECDLFLYSSNFIHS